jgi:hypothetical protein
LTSNSSHSRPRRALGAALVFILLLAAAGAAAGATPVHTSWTATEYAVFGGEASQAWRAAEVGQSPIGGVRDENGGGVTDLGRKAKAGLLSLLLPGAGQYYNGDRAKAIVFAGVEAAVWASYLTFHIQGENRADTYEEYAGIYAGTSGEHNDRYWQAVGRHMDSDAYNESVRREARALSEQPAGLVAPVDAWQWRTNDNLRTYQELRADANRAYDRRDFMILFAIVNRAVAVFDAVRNSVDDKMSTRVLGFDVAMDVRPSLNHPRAECVFTRKF